jgi:hypothetical protein
MSIKPFQSSSELMPLLSTIAMGTVIKEVLGLMFKPAVNTISTAVGGESAITVVRPQPTGVSYAASAGRDH